MTATDTYLGLRAFVDELARCGLREACTSPGSRSTPLVLSLVREARIRSTSHVDERAGAFFALGMAKVSGLPVALACTSGTAAANYLPAVVEAHEARVPLLVLTADRPPELRDVGAGQTIDQIKLYGSNAKWFLDVDDHAATPERVRWLRQLACRAYWTALDGRPGPVHLNFTLREPLVLDGPLPEEDPGPGREGGRPWVTRPRTIALPGAPLLDSLERELRERPRALLVAGRSERDPRLGPALAAFAEQAGIPLLAEPLSGARRGPAAVAHYDALLRDEGFAAAHAPDLVLRAGDLPTSGVTRRWVGGLRDALQIAFDPDTAWQDPAGSVATILGADPRATLEALAERLPARRRDTAWLDAWRAADRAAAAGIAEVLGGEGLSEPRVAAELGVRLPADATLVVASSMPVRDVETFFPVRPDPPRVLANRGANGIDGTIATALGAAAAARGPVVLYTGDVAFLHDLSALVAVRRLGSRLTIVLQDNDGGGIFHFLAVSGEGAAFEEHVATPHGMDFSAAAALFGCEHAEVADAAGLRAGLERALGSAGTTILHVRTNRYENVTVHREAWKAVSARL
ncbi:MAG: 2-succinyl-5-enolpyruvyl-6-hydroxy-3-cyclohexene-1-carboxylic-acid synthase [uncultured Solirubrobacteraceae bacterium]|uniref:2-succinyl-5-enolpyruvyl-6-hydroxy-3-cyclohexene-1-carboxylate synthase n=1 Tax=uncultured Solirubrobacteraceae bacterium TaxID=1162706 RepID=A0A6J4RVF7_9ACTN|nr:MAG: 2-succinyl-5-enolpyruvyl-6-hydroxy-3-cyclohexene-1-carboxylic-acid synthase [uncultured Solirubrobacteraceae bacterium]